MRPCKDLLYTTHLLISCYPLALAVSKWESVQMHLTYRSRALVEVNQNPPVKGVYFCEPGETGSQMNNRTSCVNTTCRWPPSLNTENKRSERLSNNSWKIIENQSHKSDKFMYFHGFVLGVTRVCPLAMNLLIVQTLCVITTPIVFSLSWEHDNTKFQNAAAEQTLGITAHDAQLFVGFC